MVHARAPDALDGLLSRAVRDRAASPRPVLQRMIRDKEEEKRSASSSTPKSTGTFKKVAAKYTAEIEPTDRGFAVKLWRPATTWSWEFGKQPVGTAAVRIFDQPATDLPEAKKPYMTEHVLGARPGKMAYLDNIKNYSVLTDEPGDIYTGVGTVLIREAEAEAKRRGALWIYLVASPTDAREDPNSGVKRRVDPAGFYRKCGYTQDKAQFAHNDELYRELIQDERVRHEYVRSLHEATWIKKL
jgi:hypothetical protein